MKLGPTLRLRVWLAISHLAVLALPVLAVALTGALAIDLREQTRASLEHQGVLIALHVEDALRRAGPEASLEALDLDAFLTRARSGTLSGVRVVDPEGVVRASSGEGHGESLGADAEVARALSEGAVGVAVRPRPPPSRSQPLWSESRRAPVRVFVAVPIVLDGRLEGAVVLSRTPKEEVQAIYQMGFPLVLGVALSLAGTLALAGLAGWLFTRSLATLASASRDLAARPGDAAVLLERPRQSHVREVGEVADALVATSARLHERLGYIAEFAGNVSHEFKTPLATLRGTVELLQDDPEMPAAQRERFLANANAELDRLQRLVGGLLGLARAEEGAPSDDVDLDAVIGAFRDHPRVVVAVGAGHVPGDAAQLGAAVSNLVENALTHGGPQATVRVSGWQRGEQAGVDVEDDGAGISAANLPHVFDRFFTTARGAGGTGLGLALVRVIARAHGGDVTVESAPGSTRFRLSLPTRPRTTRG